MIHIPTHLTWLDMTHGLSMEDKLKHAMQTMICCLEYWFSYYRLLSLSMFKDSLFWSFLSFLSFHTFFLSFLFTLSFFLSFLFTLSFFPFFSHFLSFFPFFSYFLSFLSFHTFFPFFSHFLSFFPFFSYFLSFFPFFSHFLSFLFTLSFLSFHTFFLSYFSFFIILSFIFFPIFLSFLFLFFFLLKISAVFLRNYWVRCIWDLKCHCSRCLVCNTILYFSVWAPKGLCFGVQTWDGWCLLLKSYAFGMIFYF